MMYTKQCKSCGELLPLSNFRISPPLSLRSSCKDCERLASANYKLNNKSKLDEYAIKIASNHHIFYKPIKSCTRCGLTKDITLFGINNSRKDGRASVCKECRNKDVIDQKYNLSKNQKENLKKEQNYRCAICNRHESEFKKGLAVDHCHKTGKIRGLLCINCNNGIGKFMENIKLLINAIRYLIKHNK